MQFTVRRTPLQGTGVDLSSKEEHSCKKLHSCTFKFVAMHFTVRIAPFRKGWTCRLKRVIPVKNCIAALLSLWLCISRFV